MVLSNLPRLKLWKSFAVYFTHGILPEKAPSSIGSSLEFHRPFTVFYHPLEEGDMNAVATATDVTYPESDGKPMADNTLQWDWVVRIVSELREQFAGLQVFVAGDLFWYPVRGNNRIVAAPDALVAFGRSPGYRGSYRQWEEEDVAPQVAFEVLSPGNTEKEMQGKFVFYEKYGVEECYTSRGRQ